VGEQKGMKEKMEIKETIGGRKETMRTKAIMEGQKVTKETMGG
jgi:hypothetical protein